MVTAAWESARSEPVRRDGGARSRASDAAARRQLLAELDSALGFADYCCFLGGDQVGPLAEQVVSLAQRLYDDTLSSMEHPDRGYWR